jgi:hypothetical protein
MTESELQSAIIDAAHIGGWLVAHFRKVQTPGGWRTPVGADGKGFVDLVLVHQRRGVIFAELKAASGRLEPAQQKWRSVLLAADADWRLWRPCDLDAVKAELIGRVAA